MRLKRAKKTGLGRRVYQRGGLCGADPRGRRLNWYITWLLPQPQELQLCRREGPTWLLPQPQELQLCRREGPVCWTARDDADPRGRRLNWYITWLMPQPQELQLYLQVCFCCGWSHAWREEGRIHASLFSVLDVSLLLCSSLG